MALPIRRPRGRPKITVDTPLTEAEELYVQAIISGSTKRQALLFAGIEFPPNATSAQIAHKATRVEARQNVHARLLSLGFKKTSKGWAPPPAPPPGLDSYDPANITPAWLNEQARYVFQEAISASDYGASLRALQFIAEFNGLVEKRRPGRPPNLTVPNKGDVSGNFNDKPDAPGEGASKDIDTFLGDAFDGDGAGDSEGDEPFFRVGAAGQKATGTIQRQRPAGAVDGHAGVAREEREGVSGEASGE